MCLLQPALQKFYNALRLLKQFSTENSFYDNIGCLDTFLTEYRSTTFVLQKSLGGKDHPIYIKHRDAYLGKDKALSDWFIENRNIVDHEYPFKLKKILRVIIYDSGTAVEFTKYEQIAGKDESFGNYLQEIRNTFLSILTPEISFSAQYSFVDEDDARETSIFDFIEKGIIAMWQFLHVMKVELNDDTEVANQLMNEIDILVQSMPQRWALDVIDYCYYRNGDYFERGKSINLMMPDIRMPKELLLQQAQQLSSTVKNFYEAFIYFHTFAYVEQKHHIMNTFFVEYDDGTYQTLGFLASVRTTMYRYINRVANLVKTNNVVSVYLVTETVGYEGVDMASFSKFLQLNYKEKMAYRTKTFLSFYKVTQLGEIEPVAIDADTLIDRLSVSVAIGNLKSPKEYEVHNVMLTPIVESFKEKQVSTE